MQKLEYKPGVTVGDYEIKKGPGRVPGELGTGGFGRVYYAANRHMYHVVALKTMRKSAPWSPDVWTKFCRESKFWLHLECDHHVVRARSFFLFDEERGEVLSEQDAENKREIARPFLAIDFIEGLSLKDLLNRELRLHPLQACRYGIQFCEGMRNANDTTARGRNSAPLLHRDISPDNVMISLRNTLKITDFGLARFVGMAADIQSELAGKDFYMSPEQGRCNTLKKLERLTPASDIWAFGVTLYQCLTGSFPYVSLDKIFTPGPQWIPSEWVSPGKLPYGHSNIGKLTPFSKDRKDMIRHFDELVSRCFFRSAKERLQTWKEVMDLLSLIHVKLEERLENKPPACCGACDFIPNDGSAVTCSLCGAKLVPGQTTTR
ncbi:MAG: serine/threonine-protein kinase, partial [Pseudomonadota bacterium]